MALGLWAWGPYPSADGYRPGGSLSRRRREPQRNKTDVDSAERRAMLLARE
jgi:hypothetical protein